MSHLVRSLIVLFLLLHGLASAESAAAQDHTDKERPRTTRVLVALPRDKLGAVLEWLHSTLSVKSVPVAASGDTFTLTFDLKLEPEALEHYAKLRALAGDSAVITQERLPDHKAEDSACPVAKYEQTCVGRKCKCGEEYEQSWHHIVFGIMPRFTGAIRGYNHATIDLLGQVGFKGMGVEGGLGLSLLKIQSLPDVEFHEFMPAYSADARVIFYGDTRNRTGFFLGGGLSWVPRDTIRDIGNPARRIADPRVEWWVRSPLGLEVRFGIGDDPDVLMVGRAIMEPWFPVGRFENEVTVMFGIGFGLYLGVRNPTVPYAK